MIVCLPQPTMFITVSIHEHNANCSRRSRVSREDATLKEDTAFENQSSPSVEGWLDDRASTGWTGHDTENCTGILPASWWMLTGHGPVIGE